jgi:hypothetical protein
MAMPERRGAASGGLDLRMARHLAHKWRDFREGARSDDIQDLQTLDHGTIVSVFQSQNGIREMAVRRS